MQFGMLEPADGIGLTIVVDEGETIDLDALGLAERIFDFAVLEILGCHGRKEDANGDRWAPLRPGTIGGKRRAGRTAEDIGVQSGNMLNRYRFSPGDRDIEAGQAIWSYDETGCGYARYFHFGEEGKQPARPIVGWTAAAIAFALAQVQT